MDFTFNEDQLLFQRTVREFLAAEVTTDRLRELWSSDTGRSDDLWRQLAGLGLTGLTVPEAQGGLGMDAVDFVLLAEECGYVALAEPLVHTALVAVPLLQEVGGALAAEWLPKIAAGEARVMVGLAQNRWVEDAHVADLLLLEVSGLDEPESEGSGLDGPKSGAPAGLCALDLTLADAAGVNLQAAPSVDPSRRLFVVDVDVAAQTPVQFHNPTGGDDWVQASLDRGALGCAAQALGLARRMVDMTVQYASERQQFGKPIGSFQAVKHHLANVAVRLEYAKAPVYRAAHSLAAGLPQERAGLHVSHAKLAACAAANLAARHCIQVHGAMGYTWEVDLHIFMKRAWAMANSWGDTAFHKRRVANAIFSQRIPLGAGGTFGGIVE